MLRANLRVSDDKAAYNTDNAYDIGMYNIRRNEMMWKFRARSEYFLLGENKKSKLRNQHNNTMNIY